MMTKLNLTFGLLLMTILGSCFAFGYDASSPYSVTLNWIVPSDTTFTIALAGAETTIDFNPVNKSSLEVMPDSQDAGTPIITATNQGNVNANYSALVTADKPTWVTLKGKKTNDYGTADTIGNATAVVIDTDVVPSGNATLWLWSDFNNAPSGTKATTFQIASTEA
jgi:hypothetical protein